MADDRADPSISDLEVRFRTLDGVVEAVKGINLDVKAGETVAIVGESGSGKSQTMMAAMGLLASNGEATGRVDYRGRNILGTAASRAQHASAAGKITMIFQEPMTSLDPLYTIGNQLIEPIRRHQRHRRGGGASAGHRAPEARADPGSRAADAVLSARTVGRPAPARDDRHGDRQRSRHPDRRRADDGARRHHPGPDPGICWPSCSSGSAWRSSSSPTISASSAASPTASMSCVRARWSRRATPKTMFAAPAASLYAGAAGGRADRAARRRCRHGAPAFSKARDVAVDFQLGGGFLAGQPVSCCGPSTASRVMLRAGPDDRHRRRIGLGQIDARAARCSGCCRAKARIRFEGRDICQARPAARCGRSAREMQIVFRTPSARCRRA